MAVASELTAFEVWFGRATAAERAQALGCVLSRSTDLELRLASTVAQVRVERRR